MEIIKASYRTMMQKLAQHPDLGGDHWNSTLINEAKAVLTDPAKRVEYDQELMEFHTLSELSGRQQSDKTSGQVSPSKQYTPIINLTACSVKAPIREILISCRKRNAPSAKARCILLRK